MAEKALITKFNKLAEDSEEKGYFGDAINYRFKGEVLKLLRENINQLKNLEKQIKYMWQTLDEIKERAGGKLI